ncbi:NU4M oxidoreductase, partial [Acromyrmex heyeri]
LLKMGGYGLIRLMEIYYKVMVKYNYLIFSVGIVGGIIVRILCLVQIDMKSIVAYSSVVHMNLILARFMTLFKVGILGGYIMIISHGLCSSGIFYMVNLYYERSGRRLIILNKGIIGNLPVVIMWWFIFCIVNFSFPLSLNFVGEIMILMRILNWDIYMLIYLRLICFFRAAYSLYLCSYVYHGKNIYYENKIYYSNLKEYFILIMHFFPLLIYLLNLIIFV